jgi:hypothetical protein
VVANPPFSSKNWMDGFNPSEDFMDVLKKVKFHLIKMAIMLFAAHHQITKKYG